MDEILKFCANMYIFKDLKLLKVLSFMNLKKKWTESFTSRWTKFLQFYANMYIFKDVKH